MVLKRRGAGQDDWIKKKKKRFKQAEFPRIKDGQRFRNLYKTACTACGTGSE